MLAVRCRSSDRPTTTAPSSRAGSADRTDQGDCRDPRALRLSAHSRTAAARRLAGEPKRVYRLYREMGLQLRNKTPKRRVKAKLRDDRQPATANETWAMDFVHDQLATGQAARAHDRRHLLALLAGDGAAVQLLRRRCCGDARRGSAGDGVPGDDPGRPGLRVRISDLDLWAYQRGVTLDFTRPASPPTMPSSSRSMASSGLNV